MKITRTRIPFSHLTPESASPPPGRPGSTRGRGDAGAGPGVVRCECLKCGAHSNALAAPGIHAICPNCGDSRLVPIEGAEVMAPPSL
jgi:hypothetical protein